MLALPSLGGRNGSRFAWIVPIDSLIQRQHLMMHLCLAGYRLVRPEAVGTPHRSLDDLAAVVPSSEAFGDCTKFAAAIVVV